MENLKKIRNERNISQKTVADFLGVSQQAYANYENGKRQPEYKILAILADYFNVSVDYLLGREEIKKAPAVAEAPTRENLRFALSGEVNGPLKEEQVDEVLEFARFIYERDKNKEKK